MSTTTAAAPPPRQYRCDSARGKPVQKLYHLWATDTQTGERIWLFAEPESRQPIRNMMRTRPFLRREIAALTREFGRRFTYEIVEEG